MNARALISVTDLSVAYGGVAAVAPLSFTLTTGDCLAVLGANGAGKSSLLRGLMGLAPTTGEIIFDGADIAALATADRARRGVAFVPEGRRVFAGMTVRENLEVAAHAPSARGILPDDAPGHTGFTGTSMWIDSALDCHYVLLTNRVHPRVPQREFWRLRRGFHRLALRRCSSAV